MLVGNVFTSFFAYFLNSYYSAGLILYPTIEQIKDIFPTFIISIIVAGVMWSLSFIPMSYYILLPIQIIIGLSLALLIYGRLNLPEYLEVKQLVLALLKQK